jgi:acetyl esterase/lipase
LLAALALLLVTLVSSPEALGARPRAVSSTSFPAMVESVPYGPSPSEIADIYPSDVPQSPTVIFVHGGGWKRQGPLSEFSLKAMELQQHGFTVFVINYTQDSPGVPAFPLEPNDVIAATHWAIANATSYNGNPKDVVLVGGSAGGNLVALAAEELDSASPGTVRAVVSLSGPMNFITLNSLIENETVTNETFIHSVNQALGVNNRSPTFPRSYAEEWSPALHVPTMNCPNWLIFNSEAELIPLSQAEEMYADLLKAKCKATLEVVPGAEHSFAYFNLVKSTIFSFIKAQ